MSSTLHRAPAAGRTFTADRPDSLIASVPRPTAAALAAQDVQGPGLSPTGLLALLFPPSSASTSKSTGKSKGRTGSPAAAVPAGGVPGSVRARKRRRQGVVEAEREDLPVVSAAPPLSLAASALSVARTVGLGLRLLAPNESEHDDGGRLISGSGQGDGVDEDEDNGDLTYFTPEAFLRSLPPLSTLNVQPTPALPMKTRGTHDLTLVLDLDETLVHCDTAPLPGYSHTFSVEFEGQECTVYVRTRPFMTQFLQAVSQRFEVVLFTASQRIYADQLMNILDPNPSAVRHRLFREHCVFVNGKYVKDLRILGRPLAKTLIVDNSPLAFAYQMSNGIPIKTWLQDPNDRELMALLPFLEHVADQNPRDVRPILEEQFQVHRLLNLPPVA